jgi:glyoxylase-like metal-dependent hydrolase (beta-lactamase superfamily II)
MPSEIPATPSDPSLLKSAIEWTGQLFAGDTLFAGSIGRTDLWGGSFQGIIHSIKGKLLELPDATIVYPGHGDSTTIGKERATNPFLRGN